MSILSGRFVPLKLFVKRMWWRGTYTFFRPGLPKNSEGKVYVNLGCGVNTGPEYINIDAVPMGKTHVVGTIQDLSRFPDNSVDLLYASHVIEHIPREELARSFLEWFRVLRPGGILRFGVPHFDNLIRIYTRSGNNVESIVSQLMGEEAPYDDHHSIWNEASATALLAGAGFTHIASWDPDTVEHHSFKDKTNRVVEIAGERIPLSLNLQAQKPG